MCHPTPHMQMFTSTGTYQRCLATWEAHTAKVRELILASIKADIRMRLAAAQPKADVESTQPLSLGDISRYEGELTDELQDAISATRLMRRYIPDAGSTSADVDATPESTPNGPTICGDKRGSDTGEDAQRANPMSKVAHRPPLSQQANPEAHDIHIEPRLIDTNQYEPDAGR